MERDATDTRNILIVDDDPLTVADLELLLEDMWPVRSASSASQAREIMRQEQVALVLADERMPGESGIELLAWVQRSFPDTIRILITGYTDTENLIAAINDAGIWHFIRKPWRNQELVNLIGRALEYRSSRIKLRESEQRYRDLFVNAPSGLLRVGMDGRVLEANRAMGAMLGVEDRAALKGRPVSGLCIDPASWSDVMALLLHGEEIWNRETVLVTESGAPVHTLLSARVRKDQLGQAVVEAAFVDLTGHMEARAENQRLKAQLRRFQRLETMGLLTSMLVHDFKNQMSVVIGNAYYARAADDPLVRQSCLEDIEVAATNASQLAQTLLSFARNEGSEMEPVDVNALLRRLADLLRRTLQRSSKMSPIPRPRIRIVLELEPNLPMIQARRSMLYHTFLNLCLNGLEAMDDTGTLTLRSYVEPGGGYVSVTVEDTGRGMSEEVKSRIFEPFFTTKDDQPNPGTGLGLSMVQSMVREHKGRVTVESAPGEGSKFVVTLPAGAESPRKPTPHSRTVLVGEDDQGVLNVLGRMLDRLGYEVHKFTDAVEFMRTFEEHPDVRFVVLSTSLPNMSPVEVFERCRTLRPDLPVMFTGEPIVADQGPVPMDRSGVGYLPKPFDMHQLEVSISKILGRPVI